MTRKIRAFLRQAIAEQAFPAAAFGIWQAPATLVCGALGYRLATGSLLRAHEATLFDLASLTKPLATALLALKLQARGEIDIGEPVSAFLGEAKGRIARIPLRDLLSHQSGLPAWKPLYATCKTKEEAIRQIASLRLRKGKVVYSDLGYILAGCCLEARTSRRLGDLFAKEIARPLGLRGVRFLIPPGWKRRAAATEIGNRYERAMARRLGLDPRRFPTKLRRRLIWGEVHDHNAFMLGGDGGHAGLFGDIRSVLALARLFLEGDALPPLERRLALTNQTKGAREARTIGFEMAANEGSTAGPALPVTAVGHTGFTGTSLWIDPERSRIYLLLTNRMHPRRSQADLNAIRRRFHTLAAALLDRLG